MKTMLLRFSMVDFALLLVTSCSTSGVDSWFKDSLHNVQRSEGFVVVSEDRLALLRLVKDKYGETSELAKGPYGKIVQVRFLKINEKDATLFVSIASGSVGIVGWTVECVRTPKGWLIKRQKLDPTMA